MRAKKIKIKIMSIWGNVLYEHESVDNTLKETVEKAVENSANLDGANLYRANLNSANLDGANLDGASLDGASLYGASLDGASLYGANLYRANLDGASLYGANLYGANLNGASLDGANLNSANLDGAKNINPIYINDLYSLKLMPKDTVLTFWKYLKNGKSPIQDKKIEYRVGKTYREKDFNTDETKDCGAGLNVGTLMWCLKYDCDSDIELIEVQFKVSDIVAIPYFTDGKFRVKRLRVLRKISRQQAEKMLEDITGLGKD
jgi:uncharacterized protein YjbI with pentapeptide repeats